MRVINHLALMISQSGEGENAVPLLTLTSPDGGSTESALEEAFADLSPQSTLVDSASSDNAAAPVAATMTFSEADDEEDDLLALLADDQSGLFG